MATTADKKKAAKKAEKEKAKAKAKADKEKAVAKEKAEEAGEAPEEESATDLSNPDVVTKYRQAGDIANAALAEVIKEAVAGKKITELCSIGDKYIQDACAAIYNKKIKGADGKKALMEKGIGFPTCVSVNNIVGHFTPLDSECAQVLADGDVVKIDLGVHIDGYLAVVAHTIFVGAAAPVGRIADVLSAAHIGAELALRLLKAGNKSDQVSAALEKVAADFKVSQVMGIVSHQMEQFNIDGEKVFLNKPDPEDKRDEVEFEPNEVFAIDIVMSTGEGKASEGADRCTVYKRAVEEQYNLKMKASRQTLSEINKRFPTFPFTIRELDEKTVRFGIVECRNHNLVTAYPVLREKEGEFVAHFKFTCLMLPNGTLKITGLPVDSAAWQPKESLQDASLKALLQTAAGKKKKKNKKKNKKKEEEAPELVGV